MKYKIFIFAPNEKQTINKIIDAAAQAGAGIMGSYTHCAFITKGDGNWFSGEGSNPYIGKVGEMSTVEEVKIEMECEEQVVQQVKKAILAVHPYEEVALEFLKLENIE